MNTAAISAYEQHLPQSLRPVVTLIGLPATIKLVERYGGINQQYIPERMKRTHPIALAIGFEAAAVLSEHYGRDYLGVPRCLEALIAIRNMAICERHANGEQPRDLALEYQLSERWIWEIVARERDDRQQSLF